MNQLDTLMKDVENVDSAIAAAKNRKAKARMK